ncbi:class I SAM-dependent methyltransferase [Nitrosomonas sp.]|uniref:class I SAM-dependent methyltransferase n=1 Tax=Nitrosomonas sp. TaxID=42353 RepID=UPI0026161D9F|nr:class I SAM-dependent methyltransferase [Nitrosomonas sp.]MCW5602919.1 class I SAM-dependent methyltransferase [Nitrosomonas sp.]
MSDYPIINWREAGEERSAHWCSEKAMPPPKRVLVIDDRMAADTAYHLVCEGTALLWRGDFHNAGQLLLALARRIEKKRLERKAKQTTLSPAETFHLNRQAQSQRARILGSLLIPFNADHSIPLSRAPDVRLACLEVYGPRAEAYIAPLRALQGLIGAFEWRKKGIPVPALGARIHPHYGVFAPIRSEYVGLVAGTPLPELVLTQSVAFDIGTGTGILAAMLVRRGVQRIVATDLDARAIDCARENLTRLGVASQVELVQANLFPEGQAALIVCNPPWIPARPSSPLEHAIFDPESRMLRGFLHGLSTHLAPGGEGWLILSDFAEHLGLRTRAELLAMIEAAGLKVLGKTDIKPHHPRVADTDDPLHAARAAELTSLWRLARQDGRNDQ